LVVGSIPTSRAKYKNLVSNGGVFILVFD